MLKVLACGTIMTDILVVELSKIAEPGEMIYLDRETEARIGGHPVNVAIDLIKLRINPKEIGVVAAIGKGLFGNYVKKIIKNHGFQTFLKKIEKVDTGKNVILEIKGEDRRFHLDPGANLYLDADFTKKIIKEQRPKVFCIRPGYTGLDLQVAEIFSGIKKSLVFLDICRPYKKPWTYILPALKYVNVVHCNEEEAINATATKNINEAVETFLKNGIEIITITFGKNGAKLFTADLKISQSGFDVNSIDSTGCGDAFCAGIVYKMIKWNKYTKFNQKELIEMLTHGQIVGAAASLEVGCTAGVTRKNVEKILKEQKKEILNKTKIN